MASMAILSGADTMRVGLGSALESPAGASELFVGRSRVRLGLEDLAAAIIAIAGNAVPQVRLAALRVDRYGRFGEPECDRCMPRLEGVFLLF